MARYRDIGSFNNIAELHNFLNHASIGQLLYTHTDSFNLSKHNDNGDRFIGDSVTQQIMDTSDEALNEALAYYRSRGESLNTEGDVVKAMVVRARAGGLFDLFPESGGRTIIASTMQAILKYYKDPVNVMTQLCLDHECMFHNLFDRVAPTRLPIEVKSGAEPLVEPADHLRLNRLAGIHAPQDLDRLWLGHVEYRLADQAKEDPEWSKDMFDDLYSMAWDQAGYEQLYDDYSKLDSNLEAEALMRLQAQSGMAKLAAAMVPEMLKNVDYDIDSAAEFLAGYLGQVAQVALAGHDQLLSSISTQWRNELMAREDVPRFKPMRFFDPDLGKITPEAIEYRDSRTSTPVSPIHLQIMRENKASLNAVAEARQDERKKQKAVREREVSALKSDFAVEKKEIVEYANKQINTANNEIARLGKEKRALSHRINYTPGEAMDKMFWVGEGVGKEAASIAYAACADHLREKLALHGKDASYLDKFPKLADTLKTLNTERQLAMDKIAEVMINEGRVDPRTAHSTEVAGAKSDWGEHDQTYVNLKIADIASGRTIDNINTLKTQYAPELDQLKDVPPLKAADAPKQNELQGKAPADESVELPAGAGSNGTGTTGQPML